MPEIMNIIFKEILPQYGYAVRENQIGLTEHILKTISRRAISLAESEVGTGKTMAYLVAAVLAKRADLTISGCAGITQSKAMSKVLTCRLSLLLPALRYSERLLRITYHSFQIF